MHMDTGEGCVRCREAGQSARCCRKVAKCTEKQQKVCRKHRKVAECVAKCRKVEPKHRKHRKAAK